MKFENTLACALQLDKEDKLNHLRNSFLFPQHNGKDCIYFTGNSLGLQPKNTSGEIKQVLDSWAVLGVEGHFKGENPWMHFHDKLTKPLAKIVGCLAEEIVIMNALTVNLHLMMAGFYRPTKQRYKIICEAKAFPSDQYAFASQALLHNLKPEDVIVEVKPREGKHVLHTEDIISVIEQHAGETALVLFSGINYYSGQYFNIKTITEAAHKAGAYAGFDLAHAAGNVELNLHDWNVDFACWCTYKYLNSGPGAVSGTFIHERFARDKNFPRLAGWWGNNKLTRFKMEQNFDAIPTAEGWQLSTPPALLLAAHKAALDIFEEAGIENLHQKRKTLTAYLHFILNGINQKYNYRVIEIITLANEDERGCQVSMFMHKNGKAIFDALTNEGVIADWREPNVIRVAPVPLYNKYEDVWRFGNIIENILQ
ncbi:kynureninase [Parafilimonas terrae]|uniref:Kynureninase n=1 Tax=Parafilimonas terrae TaxID=1465490 RepID=A0A1I5RXP7_9BACT|nr:kynureninase [Parafilimonas terrae]SFP62786.1 Kynureninase [Parafilimonas terrae]